MVDLFFGWISNSVTKRSIVYFLGNYILILSRSSNFIVSFLLKNFLKSAVLTKFPDLNFWVHYFSSVFEFGKYCFSFTFFKTWTGVTYFWVVDSIIVYFITDCNAVVTEAFPFSNTVIFLKTRLVLLNLSAKSVPLEGQREYLLSFLSSRILFKTFLAYFFPSSVSIGLGFTFECSFFRKFICFCLSKIIF